MLFIVSQQNLVSTFWHHCYYYTAQIHIQRSSIPKRDGKRLQKQDKILLFLHWFALLFCSSLAIFQKDAFLCVQYHFEIFPLQLFNQYFRCTIFIQKRNSNLIGLWQQVNFATLLPKALLLFLPAWQCTFAQRDVEL